MTFSDGAVARWLSENYDLLRARSFGQLLRSISLKKNNYSPLLIEIPGSKSHTLATTLVLGQPPSASSVITDNRTVVKSRALAARFIGSVMLPF